jgi:hypothetical protein
MTLAPFAVTALPGANGAIAKVQAAATDRSWTLEAVPGNGRASVELSARSLDGVMPLAVKLTDVTAKGVATPAGLALSEFDGKLMGGVLRGKGQLKWGDAWSFDGDVTVRQLEVAQIAPKLVQGGRMELAGAVSAGAPSAEKLFAAPRMDGTFTVTKGTLAGIDLARMMGAGASTGGTTVFNEFAGRATFDQSKLSLRDLRMNAGLLGLSGTADVDPAGALAGNLRAELRTPSGGVQRASIALSGNVSSGMQARR